MSVDDAPGTAVSAQNDQPKPANEAIRSDPVPPRANTDAAGPTTPPISVTANSASDGIGSTIEPASAPTTPPRIAVPHIPGPDTVPGRKTANLDLPAPIGSGRETANLNGVKSMPGSRRTSRYDVASSLTSGLEKMSLSAVEDSGKPWHLHDEEDVDAEGARSA
jgi:hypothetical protein